MWSTLLDPPLAPTPATEAARVRAVPKQLELLNALLWLSTILLSISTASSAILYALAGAAATSLLLASLAAREEAQAVDVVNRKSGRVQAKMLLPRTPAEQRVAAGSWSLLAVLLSYLGALAVCNRVLATAALPRSLLYAFAAQRLLDTLVVWVLSEPHLARLRPLEVSALRLCSLASLVPLLHVVVARSLPQHLENVDTVPALLWYGYCGIAFATFFFSASQLKGFPRLRALGMQLAGLLFLPAAVISCLTYVGTLFPASFVRPDWLSEWALWIGSWWHTVEVDATVDPTAAAQAAAEATGRLELELLAVVTTMSASLLFITQLSKTVSLSLLIESGRKPILGVWVVSLAVVFVRLLLES